MLDKCVLALIILNSHFANPQDIDILKNIFKGNKNPPLVVLLNTHERKGAILDLPKLENDDTRIKKQDDEGAYMLYHLLRITQENEDLDDATNLTFEKTKDMLRASLRSRCNQYERCVRKCVTKRYTCTITCKEVYDVYEVCVQPVCGNRCWGKTMPPSWLLK